MAVSPQQPRRVGPLVWALAVLLLVASAGLYAVMRAEPASVGSEDVIVVPEAPAPTPLMKPK